MCRATRLKLATLNLQGPASASSATPPPPLLVAVPVGRREVLAVEEGLSPSVYIDCQATLALSVTYGKGDVNKPVGSGAKERVRT